MSKGECHRILAIIKMIDSVMAYISTLGIKKCPYWPTKSMASTKNINKIYLIWFDQLGCTVAIS